MQTKVSMQAEIAGISFDNLLLNAAGIRCSTVQDLNSILTSEAGGVVTKSATVEERAGNESPRMRALPLGSINSMGLPNHGFDYYMAYVLKAQSAGYNNVILSVAGLSPADDLLMLREIQQSGFDGLVELNLSCPNVKGKPQVGYDFAAVEQLLGEIFKFFDKRLGLKLPPYFDLTQFDEMAAIINQYPVTYVNSINSIGNGLVIDPVTETAVIKPKGGFGGLGGEYAKPTALANVRGFRQRLKPEIQMIGTGGIKSGMDVFEHVLCGADLVQIGTAFGSEGTPIFDRISQELQDIMIEKGYRRLADFRGKLKTL
ncbi:dihydroorotate oxidase [Lentilactobacillus sp. SPB1-3]|uniref:Dihydroorotate oxidase n=1 Tax=Lentilactobacillus terminaliae TaxID=3003483 RepID=A0ACD5DET0_9LACO|nr:dihydroorotate oxidase [Lentilactobacillus sp. SPB1-3]MCZ0976428.1 dihydroorotate oxidase [Lentilactobacillus sp. SPB1-3]